MSPENPTLTSSPIEQMWRSTMNAPLTLEILKPVVPQMRQELISVGVDLSPTPEKISSLAKKQFRDLETNRGVGVDLALRQAKVNGGELLLFCDKRCADSPGVKNVDDSRGIGLRQVSADLIQLLINESPSDGQIQKFVLRTNRRIKKDTERKTCQAPEPVKVAYSDILKITPDKKWHEFKSIPYDSLPDLWSFLVGKNTESDSAV
jgi:hypothetical protein